MADAEDVTVIGQGSRVTGRITGDGSLEILGHVDGEVEVTGEVTVGDEGLVGSNVVARRIVVRGAVRGDLTASESIALDSNARVIGDLRAPRIAVTAGALIRGNVQTSEAGAAPARTQARRATASEPRARENAAALPAPSRAVRAEAPTPAAAGRNGAAVPPAPRSVREIARPAVKAAAVSPPPRAKTAPAPVVPVLKKGAKGAMKKRAGA